MTLKGNIKTILYRCLPLKTYIKILYKHYHGGKINLENPQKFTEKLFWLKIYNGKYKKELASKIYDKFRARDYIETRVGKQYLPKLYGVYSCADEIDFSNLPSKYVLKITQSCGFNIINDGKLTMSENDIKQQLQIWLDETNSAKFIRDNIREESYYYDQNAKIMCEEYLEDSKGNVCIDSAFFCFNGEAKYWDIVYDSVNLDDGVKNEGAFPRNIYDINGNYIPMLLGRPTDESLGKIEYINFDKMAELAGKLSEGWPFLRVDIYNADGRIIIGELTPIPLGGAAKIDPVDYDYAWGELIKLPDCKELFE